MNNNLTLKVQPHKVRLKKQYIRQHKVQLLFQQLTQLCLYILLSSCSSFVFAQPQKVLTVEMGIYTGTYTKYPQYMHPDICQSPPNYQDEQIDRTLGEVFILCEAISAAGYQLKPNFHSLPNDLRGLLLLESGMLDALSSSLWPFQFEHADVYVSQASIQKGEFEKGIYVSSKNKKLLSQTMYKSDIKKLIGLTIRQWKHDLIVMQEITPKVLQIEYNPSVFKLLDTQRADFVLLEFSNQANLEICQDLMCITPLNGIKVAIKDTRHFVASKTSQNGKLYFQLLTEGMIKLRAKGRIRQLYQEMGLINAKVKDWQVIN